MAPSIDPTPRRPTLDELRRAPRPRSLPVIVDALPAQRHLPLRDEASAVDRVRPVYCVWEITLACDLACRHCGSRAGRARPEELNTAQALDLAGQLIELGLKEVTLIGGEAYLRRDWLQIVGKLAQGGVTVSMATGGRGVTREVARAAKDAGLSAASVSIDGMRDTHDRLRGAQGVFDAALSAMDNIREAGLDLYNNSQINRLSIPDFPELLETLIGRGTRAWQIMVTVPMGRAVDEPEVLLQPYDLLEVFPLLARLKERADEAGVRIWRGNTLGYFGPYESLFQGWLPKGHGGSCGAGKTTMGIEADGTIKGCPSLGTVKWGGGNIRDANLEAIWTRAEPLRFNRTRTTRDLWGYCAECYYADTCRAGCTWMSDMLLGRPGNNPYCHHRALEMQRMGRRERVVQVEAAPGLPFDQGRFEIIEEPLDPSKDAVPSDLNLPASANSSTIASAKPNSSSPSSTRLLTTTKEAAP